MMNYLDCFSSGVREMPRFMGVAGAVIRQVEDLQAVVRGLAEDFSMEGAVGVQLSVVGAGMGVPRPGGMADEDYRVLIRDKLRLWQWNGTNEEVAEVVNDIDPGGGERDNGNLTVTISPTDGLPVGAEELYPVVAGVRICR
ncbi:MAG: hypothetical protein IKE08_02180 [Clostridia bacterium]|nr:hypothetical protein [Clostridia bacterium]